MAGTQTKMKSEFFRAISQLAAERGLSPEVVLEAVEQAMISAYRKDYGGGANTRAQVDPEMGEVRIFTEKQVMEEVEDDNLQITLAEARVLDPHVEIGKTVLIETTPPNFGRIAAQTAKQVILQRIREAEREAIYVTFSEREGEIITGTVQSIDSQGIILSLGRAEALLPRSEQIPGERSRLRQRLRVYVTEVKKTTRGPEIIVSRAHKSMLRRLLELEVPEIFNGQVEIRAIAREPGSRSKVAVAALQPGVDPVGACVGMRGVRIQSIVNELGGERIDVIEWSRDTREFIARALSPAHPLNVELFEMDGEKTAIAVVPEKQLSLAIGREGQNVRLAVKLTSWKIDILSPAAAQERIAKLAEEREARLAAEREAALAEAALKVEASSPIPALGLSTRVVSALEQAGITEVGLLLDKLASGEEALQGIPGIGPKSREEILERLRQAELYPLEVVEEEKPSVEEAAPVEREALPPEVEPGPAEIPIAPAVEVEAKPFEEEQVFAQRKEKPKGKKRPKPGRRREEWEEDLALLDSEALDLKSGFEEPQEEEEASEE